MMANPGDVLIRGEVDGGFEVVDAVTLKRISDHLSAFDAALAVARRAGGRIWQQAVDNRGRPLSDPVPLEPL